MFHATLALLTTKSLGASKHSGVTRLFHEHFGFPATFNQDIARPQRVHLTRISLIIVNWYTIEEEASET